MKKKTVNEGMQTIGGILIPASVKLKLKMIALEEGTTLTAIVNEALAERAKEGTRKKEGKEERFQEESETNEIARKAKSVRARMK